MSTDNNNCPLDFYDKGKCYWQQVEPNIDGMLGGFANVNVHDADESRGLLKKMFKQFGLTNNQAVKPLRVLDCGAGIGRVTKYVLSKFFDQIDLLEQNESFLASSKSYLGETYSKVQNTFAQGIQQFEPLPNVKYDCIWGQWVLGYITDEDLVLFLQKCANILHKPNGFIVVKDNITKSDVSIVDEEDGSVTRPDDLFKRIFQQVDSLELKLVIKQKKIPRELYPVRMYVLTLKVSE